MQALTTEQRVAARAAAKRAQVAGRNAYVAAFDALLASYGVSAASESYANDFTAAGLDYHTLDRAAVEAVEVAPTTEPGDKIVSVRNGPDRGTCIVRTADGRRFLSHASDTFGLYPHLGAPITGYPKAELL